MLEAALRREFLKRVDKHLREGGFVQIIQDPPRPFREEQTGYQHLLIAGARRRCVSLDEPDTFVVSLHQRSIDLGRNQRTGGSLTLDASKITSSPISGEEDKERHVFVTLTSSRRNGLLPTARGVIVERCDWGYYDEEQPKLGYGESDGDTAIEMVNYYFEAELGDPTTIEKVRSLHHIADLVLKHTLHPEAPPKGVEVVKCGPVGEILGLDVEFYLSDFEKREPVADLSGTFQAVKERLAIGE